MWCTYPTKVLRLRCRTCWLAKLTITLILQAAFPTSAKGVRVCSLSLAPSDRPSFPTHLRWPNWVAKGVELGNWFGVFAPASTPTEITVRLEREIAKAIRSARSQAAFCRPRH